MVLKAISNAKNTLLKYRRKVVYMCSDPISGIVQTGIFCARNTGKIATGKDTGRLGATGAQLVSLTDKVSHNASIFGEKVLKTIDGADGFICDTLKNMGKEEIADTLKATAKASNGSVVGTIASKAVNPLLVAAAGIRVLKDDDHYAALIEETSAMGMMFGAEKLMKTAKNTFFDIAENGAKEITESKGFTQGIKNLATTGLNKAAKWFSGLSKGGQMATKVGIGLLFVAGSITAYNAGKAIGKKLSGRDGVENTTKNTVEVPVKGTTQG